MKQADKYFCQMGWNHQLETSSHPATPPNRLKAESYDDSSLQVRLYLGGGLKHLFVFNPYLGKWSKLTKKNQMGWKHQLGKISDGSLCVIQLYT